MNPYGEVPDDNTGARAPSRSIAWFFACCLGLSFVDRIGDKIGVSGFLSNLLHHWREITHAFWAQLFSFIHWALPIAPNRTQMDVLTVIALIYSACASVIARRWIIARMRGVSAAIVQNENDELVPLLFGVSLVVVATFFALDLSRTFSEALAAITVCTLLAGAFCFAMETALAAAGWFSRICWFCLSVTPCAIISLPFPEPHTGRVGDSELGAILASPPHFTLILAMAALLCVGAYMVRLISPFVLLRGIVVAVGILLADLVWRLGVDACRLVGLCTL